jgi:hypothetical protein
VGHSVARAAPAKLGNRSYFFDGMAIVFKYGFYSGIGTSLATMGSIRCEPDLMGGRTT